MIVDVEELSARSSRLWPTDADVLLYLHVERHERRIATRSFLAPTKCGFSSIVDSGNPVRHIDERKRP